MSWLQKLLPPKIKSKTSFAKTGVPEGLWSKCSSCEAVLYRTDLENNLHVCPKCGFHTPLSARKRLELLLDSSGQFEIGSEVKPVDPLKFKDSKKYSDRLQAAAEDTGEDDALLVMQGSVHNIPLVAAAFEFKFIGGSMGSVVGERFVRAIYTCLDQNLPFVCISASGGARMQEALISLMQMAKTSAVIERMKQQGVPYISVMTDPVYGGVSASLALLGDLNIAEPGARAGFAGPGIIEQTIRQKLPKGFQRSEFLLDHGAIDMIVHRKDMRDKLSSLLARLTHQSAVVSASA